MLIAQVCLAILAAIWFGYPAIMAVLARVRRAPRAREGELPSVSVILATRAEAGAIRRRVENLLEADYPGDLLEILVCVDHGAGEVAGLTEAVAEVSQRRGSTVRVVAGPAPGGKAVTVNAGVAEARGTILVFADTAQWFEGGAIRQLVGHLADARVGAASGRLLMAEETVPATLAEWYWRLERRLRRDEARVHSAVGVTGAIYAMRRELFVPFPAGLILDDLFTPMQLVLRGYRVGYVDEAIAREPRRFSLDEERRRKVRTLTGVWQLCRWMPGVLLPWRNPIWPQFIAHKLLRFTSPLLVLIGVGGMVGEALLAARAAAGGPVLAGVLLSAAAMVGLRPARRLVWELVHVNVALLQAAVNGVLGRWQVW
ncbi:MAG TPA: glycosyltransferase [Gemmatimonadaceae bacterium]|nr:glycosyltransferase [Gemmatimonadaceae bacterium]